MPSVPFAHIRAMAATPFKTGENGVRTQEIHNASYIESVIINNYDLKMSLMA